MLPAGTTVAGYRIDDVLGEGGMGVVYRATQLSLNRVVALKLLTGEFAQDTGFRARFEQEGQLQAALDDEHIVPVYEAGQIEDGLFIAMRLIDGPTLKDLILADQLDPRRTLRLLAQVAHALDTAHDAGLIHRDIKPQNILIGRSDHVYLADFGLTKAPGDSTRLTSTGQFIGTIDYVAPEQIRSEPPTAASDCYALAAVLYECLAGEVPYPRPNETATIYAHLMDPPPRPSERRADLPAAIDEVIALGMAKDPGERPPSARALITAATRALASASPLATPAQQTRLSGALASPAATVAAGSPRVGVATAPSPVASETAAAAAVAPGETKKRAPGAAAAPAAPSHALRYVALIALAAAAIAAGVILGRSGKGTSSSGAFASSAAVGHIELRYPAGWQIAASPPSLPGISFAEPVGLTATRGGGQFVAGEVADASGPTLLPASFLRRVDGRLPAAAPVALGSVQAYRYMGLHIAGLNGSATIYAAPTSAGVATLACWGSGGQAPAREAQCGQIAATLRLVAATAYPLGPSPAYAKLISHTFSSLRASARAPAAQLAQATTPSAQASAARSLAAAYRQSATTLAEASTSPMVRDANQAIVTDLRRVADGYSGAAAAAASQATSAFQRAGNQIAAASASLSTAFHRLSTLGYPVGG